MQLEGIHHITAITGDAPGNVDFYTRVMGLRHGRQDGQPGRPDASTTSSTPTSGAAPARS